MKYPAITKVAVKVELTQASAMTIQTGFWQRLFRGVSVQGDTPSAAPRPTATYHAPTTAPSSTSNSPNDQVSDSGRYTVTVWACTGEPIGHPVHLFCDAT